MRSMGKKKAGMRRGETSVSILSLLPAHCRITMFESFCDQSDFNCTYTHTFY